jgi:hypothetical protein
MTFADIGGGRKNHFDLMRLALAVLVIFHHSYSVLNLGRGAAALDLRRG